MNRIPPEVASKIVSSDALPREDARNLTRTNQLLRYAALPKSWSDLYVSVEAEDGGQRGQEDAARRLEDFMLELPHLHIFVEHVVLKLLGGQSLLNARLVQTSLTRVLRILADLLPLLSSLREFGWQEDETVTFDPEAGAAMLSVLTALLRSPVATLTVHGSLFPLLATPRLADAILQSRLERVNLLYDLEDGSFDQTAALSHAPKLTSLDILFCDFMVRRRGIEPARIYNQSCGRVLGQAQTSLPYR